MTCGREPRTHSELRAYMSERKRELEASQAARRNCPDCGGIGFYPVPKGTSWTNQLCPHTHTNAMKEAAE